MVSKDDHWFNDSVVSRIARGPGFESRLGHDFFSLVTFGGRCGFAARATIIKKVHVSLFRADSGTNLIKQGGNVKGRPCGSVAQLAVLARLARGPGFESWSGHDFFLPCDIHTVQKFDFLNNPFSNNLIPD